VSKPRKNLINRQSSTKPVMTYKSVSDISCGNAVRNSDMPQRGDVMVAACPSRKVLEHITSRWGVLALITLESGTQRFSALRHKIGGGVSERMLAQTLQRLVGDGLVDRVAYDIVPPHVEYSLTPLGREAAEKVRALADWVENSLPRILNQTDALDVGS
jgi:DNA-binding HxlR family transcriptional regulator